MATLTIDAQTALGATRAGKATFALVDANQNPVNGYVTSTGSAVVAPDSVAIPATGTVSVSLVANSLITPANTYWLMTVHGAPEKFLLNKGTGTETILQCLAEDPSDLVPTLYAQLQAIVEAQMPYGQQLGQSELTGFYAARVAGAARVLIIGDSRTFLARWPDHVDRYLADRDNIARSPGSSAFPTAAAGWTGTGTEAENADGGSGWKTTLTVGQSRTRTFDEPTTSLSVEYQQGGGTFTITKNATVVNTTNTTTATARTWDLATSTPSTLNTDAWTITCTAGTVVIGDITPHAETTLTAGTKVIMAAHSGYDFDEFLDLSSIEQTWVAWAPHVVILAGSVNESTSTLVTTYLNTLIDAIRVDLPDVEIVVVAPEVLGIQGSSAATRRAYSDAALAVATAKGCAYVNLHSIVGSIHYDGNAERYSGDYIHGDGQWNQLLADAMISILSGDPYAALLGAPARIRALVRAESNDVRFRVLQRGRFFTGNVENLGYQARALYNATDEAGGSTHQPQLLEVSQAFATFLTGVGITTPGPGWLLGPGGSTVATDWIGRISAALTGTTADWQARSLAATGLTGAALATRLVGRTAAVAPTSGTFSVGDMVTTTTGRVLTCTVAGTPGTWVQVGADDAPSGALRPTAATTENFERRNTTFANNAALATGSVYVVRHFYRAGTVVNSLTWYSGTTPASVPLNQWSGIADGSTLAILAVSADATTAAWAANTPKPFSMGTPYTVPADGEYYDFLCVKATTPPSLHCKVNSNGTIIALAPVLCGQTSTGQTTPMAVGATLAAVTVGHTAAAYVTSA